MQDFPNPWQLVALISISSIQNHHCVYSRSIWWGALPSSVVSCFCNSKHSRQWSRGWTSVLTYPCNQVITDIYFKIRDKLAHIFSHFFYGNITSTLNPCETPTPPKGPVPDLADFSFLGNPGSLGNYTLTWTRALHCSSCQICPEWLWHHWCRGTFLSWYPLLRGFLSPRVEMHCIPEMWVDWSGLVPNGKASPHFFVHP